MSRIIIYCLITWFCSFNTYGQLTFDSVYVNIDFENGLDSIIIFSTDTAGTSWEIGQPSKLNFNEAISPTRAIMTDTIDPVEINTNTWFEVPFVPGNYDSTLFYGFCPLQICFTHRLEKPSSLEAAAWIDIRDNNEHYNAGSLDFENFGLHGNYYGYNSSYGENTYLPGDISYNGEPGFTIPMDVTETCYQFWGVSAGAPSNTGIHDTIYFRFNFATTPTSNPIWEGWLIDNIYIGKGIGWTCYTEGLNNNDKINMNIYPNPTADDMYVQLPSEFSSGNIFVEDICGRVIWQNTIENINHFTIDAGILSAGTYYLVLETVDYRAVKKIIKQ